MANPDARFGLRPVRHITGAPWNGATIRCYVSASYATALFIGDPVDFETTLTNIPTAPRVPTVIRAAMTDTNPVLGVITSFDPNPDNLTLQYRPLSTARYCQVCVDPTVVYQVRDNAGAAVTKVVIGQNAVGIFTHAGNTITGLSGFELSTTTAPAANSSYPLLIIGAADIEDNEWDGTASTHVIWEVLLSTARFAGSSGSDYGMLGVTAT